MPFPTDQSSTSAADAARELLTLGRPVRMGTVTYIAQCDAGSLALHDFLGYVVNTVQRTSARWAFLKGISGVQAELRAILVGRWADDAAVTADLNAAQSAMDTLVSSVETAVANNYTSAAGWVESLKIVAHAFSQRQVTAAGQLTTLRGLLVTLQGAFES